MKFLIERDIEKCSGIYIIRNGIDGRIYIGSTKNFIDRYKGHVKSINKNKHHSNHLLKFVLKYGIENLSFELLERCDVANLLEREQCWLNKLLPFGDRGFNTLKIAGSSEGYIMLDDQKQKLRLANLGKKATDETKEKLKIKRVGRKPNLGKKRSDKCKLEQSIKMIGRPAHNKGKPANINQLNALAKYRNSSATTETKKKISASKRGGKNPNAKKVFDSLTGFTFLSIKEAADHYNINKGLLARRLKYQSCVTNSHLSYA